MNNGVPRSAAGQAAAILIIVFTLAWMIQPRYDSGHGDSKVSKAKADLSLLREAIDQFKLDCGRYPTTQEGYSSLYKEPEGLSGWRGPYLQAKWANDPWDHPYVYRSPGPSGVDGYMVESYGADGKPGGTRDDADIKDGSD